MEKINPQNIKNFVSELLYDEKVILRKDPSYPKISIVTPTYNQAEFLEKSILSVLNQNYPNLEYIIMDGGSSDSTLDVIRKYGNCITYWESKQDRGQSHAINKGLKMATGEFIGWQNSDDIYLPNAFHEFLFNLKKYRGYDIYYSNTIKIDKDENVLDVKYLCPPKKFYAKYRGMISNNQSSFFSGQVILDIGGIDENLDFAMDRDFFLRCILKDKKFKFVDSYWGSFRYHHESKSGKDNLAAWKKERVHVMKKNNIYSGGFLPILNVLAMGQRLITLLKSKNLKAYISNKINYSISQRTGIPPKKWTP